jgi:hypothetical protein
MIRIFIPIFLSLICQVVQAQNFATPYVTEVAFYDRGSLSGTPDLNVDLVRGSCGFKDQNGDGDTIDPGDIDPEPFFDTLVSVTIKNPTSVPVNVSKLYYRLPNAKGKLKSWLGGLSPVSSGFVQAQGQATISYFVFRSNEAGKNTFKPYLSLSTSLGFQDFSLRLDARSSSGRLQRIIAKRGLSFGNEDRCSSS